MSNLLQHRGAIEASTEDNCLFGKQLFIRALVNYEGETIAELQASLREAVNDYMATCQELGS